VGWAAWIIEIVPVETPKNLGANRQPETTINKQPSSQGLGCFALCLFLNWLCGICNGGHTISAGFSECTDSSFDASSSRRFQRHSYAEALDGVFITKKGFGIWRPDGGGIWRRKPYAEVMGTGVGAAQE
jgi:hypothetical protein